MSIQNVFVAGGGVLGSQIAYQAAYTGFKVTSYDLHPEKVQKRIETLRAGYKQDLKTTDQQFDNGLANLSYISQLPEKIDADLIIEALPEVLDLKKSFLKEISQKVSTKTIIASNSSTFTPSQLKDSVTDPARFLNMHFANRIRLYNSAEIMGHPGTDPAVIEQVIAFARKMKMVPVHIKKEKAGYIGNTLLTPWFNAALDLWANDYATPQDIDREWIISQGASVGPFMLFDMVGLRTAYQITTNELQAEPDNQTYQRAAKRLKQMLDAGKLGQESGEGFYHYPNPEFEQDDFLTK